MYNVAKELGVIHKRRPQDFANFLPPPLVRTERTFLSFSLPPCLSFLSLSLSLSFPLLFVLRPFSPTPLFLSFSISHSCLCFYLSLSPSLSHSCLCFYLSLSHPLSLLTLLSLFPSFSLPRSCLCFNFCLFPTRAF